MNTLKAQIKDLSAYCDISPRMAGILQRFFLYATVNEDEEELDNWINARKEHSELFDLLCHVNKDGTGAGTLRMIVKMAEKPALKLSRWRKLRRRILVGLFLVYFLELLLPSHPISTMIYGPHGRDFITQTVETGDETKTVWLLDSTRVELMPHSKLGYSGTIMRGDRQVRLWGSANFDVRYSYIRPFRVRVDDVWVEIIEGTKYLKSENTELTIKPNN